MLKSNARLCPGVFIPQNTQWASVPMRIDFLRHGTFHVRPTPLAPYNDQGGCTIKVQGSNILQLGPTGAGLDDAYDALKTGAFLDVGGFSNGTLNVAGAAGVPNPNGKAFSNLGWADSGISFVYPSGTSADILLPTLPQGGPPPAFDFNWIRIVVSGTGPSGITLDVWAKFKSGGG